jgi:putative ABC transport system ATP-binding protein
MSVYSTTKRVVDAKSVIKDYGDGATAFRALKGVDFHANQGEFVILSGPSGSGKTTLVSILGCVLSATSGTVRILDEVITGVSESDLPKLRLAYIGFIFQGHNLIASMTAQENVALMLSLRGWNAIDAKKEAARLLSLVELGDKVESLPADLSGGQRQRVSIARCIAGNPPIVLADEPTASLDAQTGQLVTEVLHNLAKKRGHTVITVTHDNRIYHFADRIVHIEDGLIIDEKKDSHP